MKPVMAALAAALLLVGCSAGTEIDRAEAVQKACAETEGYTARAEVAVAREDETLHYTLDVARDKNGANLTVVEPETLAGVGVRVSEEGLKLSYDGIVLDAGSADPNLSAVNATEIVWHAVTDGWIAERGMENLDGREMLRLCFETEWGGQALRVAVWFDEADVPLCAAIEENGEILAEIQFTGFAFCDTIP